MTTISGWRTTFSSLENPSFRSYWLSTTAAAAAMQMRMVAGGWLAYDLTDSAMALGLISFATGVPLLILSPFGGVIGDRVDKRKLLIVTQALTALMNLVIAVLILIEVIELWHLIIGSLANGIILSFIMPSRRAIVPQLVGQHQLMNAIALNSGSMNLTRIVAPALAGVLVGIAGVGGVYLLMVALWVVSVVLMFPVPTLGRAARDLNTTVRSDFMEGLRYVRRSPILLSLLALAFVPVIFGMPYMILMPVFASDVFNVGASGLGLLLAMPGIGALAGSFVIASRGDFRHKGLFLLGSSMLFGILLIVFAQSGSYGLALFFLLGVGVASVAYMTINNTLTQFNTDDHMRGRVMGLLGISIGLMPVGTLGAAAIAESVSAPFAIAMGGGAIVLFTLAMAVLIPRLRSL